MNIEDFYTHTGENNQSCINLFENEWSTKFPARFNVDSKGSAGLFEDERIDWAIRSLEKLGVNIIGKKILELGPLEAAHTVMLEEKGAKSITSVEANSRAFLKCLIVKELAQLKASRFIFADGIAFLQETDEMYDIGFASGFLYHMTDPIRLIDRLSKKCRSIYIWTVYYDKKFCVDNPEHAGKFEDATSENYSGLAYTSYPYNYGAATSWRGFCGGPKSYSKWLAQDTIIEALKYFGFSKLIYRKEPNPNGCSISIVATKSDSM